MNFLQSMRKEPGMGPERCDVAVTPLSFDIAGLELYLPLLAGAPLCWRIAGKQWMALVDDEELDQGDDTIMQATPATWRMVVQSGWRGRESESAVWRGMIPRELARRAYRQVRVRLELVRADRNHHLVDPGAGPTVRTRRLPSAVPSTIRRSYVLDPNREPVPVGVPGRTVYRGRWIGQGIPGNAPQLTRKSLSRIRSSPRNGCISTGDQVKW